MYLLLGYVYCLYVQIFPSKAGQTDLSQAQLIKIDHMEKWKSREANFGWRRGK